MTNATIPVSLPEEDYLKIIDIVRHLYRCQTKPELRQCIQKHLLVWMEVDYAAWGWIDLDLKSKTVLGRQLMDCAGISENEFNVVEEMLHYHKHLFEFAENGIRTVSAVDVDFTRELLAEQVGSYFSDHPEYDRDQMKVGKLISAMGFLDRPSFTVGLGLNRVYPNTQPFTLRDIRRFELLQPSLVHTIKRIAIQEQLQTYKALITALGKSQAPCALVREDSRVLFRNPAFHAVVQVEPGSLLPKELRDLVEQQIAQLNPDRRPDTAAPPMAFYNSPDAVYRLSVTQLHPSGNEEAESVWLVRLHSVDDSYTRINLKLQKAGLTPREVEIAILVGDGLEDADIAQRLFISSSTVKNHLKSIYKKLDVHSRTQLVACLRPSPDKLEV